ncbi:T6SS immunity protein Tli4 family protein [Burkholderia pyrrocinia]|uniref:T6SS immunity protein Tli4 family protein n=1 Tax=Burkholderia pyrrocinia TaxID=60550 RepID=UPI0030CDAE2F
MTPIKILAISIFAIFLASCNRPTRLNEKERAVVTALTKKMGVHCIGRYQISMPEDVLTFGRAKIQGVSFDAKPMSVDEYRHAIDAYEATLKATTSPLGYRFLYEYGEGPSKGTKYFVHLEYEGQSGDMSRLVEAYKWDAGYQIKLQIEARDQVNSEYVKENKGTPYGIPGELINDVPEKKQLIFDLLRRVEGRADQSIPAVPGVCFLGGFLPGKAGNPEVVATQFVPLNHRDVSFDIETDTEIGEPNTLLERGESINGVLRHNGGRTIRKGRVTLEGMEAEEWLLSGKTTLGVPGHHLTLEANSKTGSAETPLLTLDMDTGAPNRVLQDKIDKASLTEAEAIAVWDAVSRSLRPRPNAF